MRCGERGESSSDEGGARSRGVAAQSVFGSRPPFDGRVLVARSAKERRGAWRVSLNLQPRVRLEQGRVVEVLGWGAREALALHMGECVCVVVVVRRVR